MAATGFRVIRTWRPSPPVLALRNACHSRLSPAPTLGGPPSAPGPRLYLDRSPSARLQPPLRPPRPRRDPPPAPHTPPSADGRTDPLGAPLPLSGDGGGGCASADTPSAPPTPPPSRPTPLTHPRVTGPPRGPIAQHTHTGPPAQPPGWASVPPGPPRRANTCPSPATFGGPPDFFLDRPASTGHLRHTVELVTKRSPPCRTFRVHHFTHS